MVLFSPKKVREQCLIVTQFCIYFCFKQEFEKNKFLTLTIDILFIHMVFGYNLISLQIKYTISNGAELAILGQETVDPA